MCHGRPTRAQAIARRFFALALLLAAGASAQAPSDAIVFVPGVTGSRLENPSNGQVLWGDSSRVFTPRDRGYSTILPLTTDADDGIRPTEILSHLRLFGYTREVYRPLRKHLTAQGHTVGDLDAPSPESDLYFFAYDWRRENQRAVEALDRALRRVVTARKTDRVRLLCQSNAGRICRYLAKYGGAAPDRVDAAIADGGEIAGGLERPPYRIVQLVLISNSHGGALRQLHEMHKGRRYVPGVGRFMAPETLFALRTLFEDLPFYREDLFLDRQGIPVAVDLFEAQEWKRLGFSIFQREVERRLRNETATFGTVNDRIEYLERRLQEARQGNELLLRDSAFFEASLCLLQNTTKATIERALLLGSDEDGWRLVFDGDRGVPRALRSRLTSQGDGHGTEESQNHLSKQEQAAVSQRHAVEGGHFDTITRAETLAALSACLQ